MTLFCRQILPGLAVAAAVAGCGSGSSGGTAGSSSSGSGGQAQGSCTIYDSGQDARITVTSGGQAECSTLAASLSSGGDFWTSQAQTPSEPPLLMVCVMDDNASQAEVIDDGGQIIGQSVCSNFLSSGWTEDTSAEAAARQQEQQQANAQAQASASASAQAATQQQDSNDQQTAQTDLGTLQQDASLTSSGTLPGDLSSFASDVQTAGTDLNTEKQDAGADNSYCSAVQSVAGDAQSVDGDLQSVQADVQSITPDISTVRQDIATVEGNQQTLSSDGLPGLQGAGAAVSTAHANLAAVIAKANSYIDQVNAIDAEAYSLANGMAIGSCSGDGPGSPTSPIGHI